MRVLLRGLIAAFSLFAFACSAQDDGASKYVEGTHYKKVRQAQTPSDPKRIEVAEFFWYGCPHCYSLDPTIEAWAKTRASDVDFVRYPATLGRPDGKLHARAFYTAEVLNVFDAMHPAMFEAIHKNGLPLSSEAQIQQLFNTSTGVLPDVFAATFGGFTVDARARKAEQLAMSYGIVSVPTIVVGGKYQTSAAMTGSFQELTKAIDALVDKIRKERGGR